MKRHILVGGCLAAGATLILSGCEGLLFAEDRTVLAKASLNNETLLVNADLRAIVSVTPAGIPYPGRVEPRRVICAEPSPDVAKAIASSFGGAVSGAVSRGDIDAQAAGQFSRSFAEGLVQLGERMATIQLLRDGLYRACEAYANGVLTDTSYAMILSRYGDTMVTLLGGELAAGAFGRSLAAISAQAAGGGGRGASDEEISDARKRLADQRKVVNDLVAKLGTATNANRVQLEKQLADARAVALSYTRAYPVVTHTHYM